MNEKTSSSAAHWNTGRSYAESGRTAAGRPVHLRHGLNDVRTRRARVFEKNRGSRFSRCEPQQGHGGRQAQAG